MFCTYVLAYTLVAVSFLGHFATPSPMEITNGELNVQRQYKNRDVGVQQCSPVAGNDRSANLKYVIAIKSLAIWSVIKQRTLTIKTQPQIGEIAEKSPDQLTDQELIKLKQACQDGLKCVSVDQLLMLQTLQARTDDDKILTQTAITNIINVITQYTTEYHQAMYKYAEIKESDDLTKVTKMMTIIVKDNKELCQINDDAVADENNTKDDDAIDTGVSNVSTNKYLSNNETPNNGSPDKIMTPDHGPSTITNNNTDNTTDSQPNSMSKSSPTNITAVPNNVVYDSTKIIAPNTNVSNKTNDSNNTVINTSQTSNGDGGNNYVDFSNGDGDNSKGKNINNITSAGHNNKNVLRKGFVEDGNINKSEMVSYSVNNGLITKGVITMTKANNGIVSIGVLNNGPTNYGVVKNKTDNGKVMISNNINPQDYVSYVDSLYSTIIKQFKNE